MQSNHFVNVSSKLHKPTRLLLNKHGSNETCLIKEIGAGMNAY
jgi:hypothetical protein